MKSGSRTGPLDALIYADGACSGNPGPGGWGALVMFLAGEARDEERLSGGEERTTNNRMELTAVIEALSRLTKPSRVRVVSDSRYVVDAFRAGWLVKWEKNNWFTAGRTPVKNQDLWQKLLAAAAPHRVEWQWTAGHVGDFGNEEADRLAVAARKKFEAQCGRR
ncbi:MAG: ribonuclease HI [Planctomycetota bacterium]|jgi:ribonuclease HI|nr:ribonuclease HI [Planctomycetota bacterium]